MLKNYFKIAWYNLTRNKLFSAISIFGLALGISSCLIIYLIVSFEFNHDKFHPDRDRIYRVVGTFSSPTISKQSMGCVPDPVPGAIRSQVTGLQEVVMFHNYYAKVQIGPESNLKKYNMPRRGEQVSDIIIAEPAYFQIFRYHWLAGNAVSALDVPYGVVLTASKARKYFGLLAPDEYVGKEVVYNDSLRMLVSGIVEDLPPHSDFRFNDILSFSTVNGSWLSQDFTFEQWGNFREDNQCFVKLAPGADVGQIYAQFAGLMSKNMKIPPTDKLELGLQPLSEMHFNPDYADLYSRKVHMPTLYGLMGIAAFILIIAAINFINLSTAQSLKRAKEIGIRKVLGSSRAQLIFQFLCETFLLTCFAILLSMILIQPLLDLLQFLIPKGVASTIFTVRTFIFLLAISLVTSLLAGFYPALLMSASLPVTSLKGSGTNMKGAGGFLRKGLIVFQLTISLVFIIGTIVIASQLKYVLNQDMGFSKVSIINLQTARNYPPEKKLVLANKIRQIPGVKMVGISDETPAARGHRGTNFKYRGNNEVEILSQLEFADENFVPLYELQVIAGRNLVPSDTMKEFLINETGARRFGFQNPQDIVGKFFECGISDGASTKILPIVGVVADFHSQSFHEPINPVFISASNEMFVISVKLDSDGKPTDAISPALTQIRQLWQQTYPDETFEYSFFDETIARFYEKEQTTGRIVNIAMVLTILISCLGLYGLVAYTVRQRMQEIGIRKVLGATEFSIVSLLSNEFLKLVFISILVASPVAYFLMHKWLQEFAYQNGIKWWVFLLAGLAAIVITLGAVSVQAIRAALTSPARSMRSA